MKKLISIIVILLTIFFVGLGLLDIQPKQDYIRIHIRANSNLDIDQNIKYEIKDKVVSYLIPSISNCESREDFVEVINKNLNNLKQIADEILICKGFDYIAKVRFCAENFPTRSYDGVVLQKGVYDAIVIELGSAQGDNWWCVVYPPLCFVSNNSQDIMYKSRILEILKSILK